MITSAEGLIEAFGKKGVSLTAERKAQIEAVEKKYPIMISDYYLGLADFNDVEDPIQKQCIPDIAELECEEGYADDPLNETQYERVPFLVHKYRTRAAFMCSNNCYMRCRHCTRKNTVMNSKQAQRGDLDAALRYVSEHTEINDILITGGDPFVLPIDTLEYYIAGFRSLPSVNTIRIGTRVIVVEPERITDELADMIAKYHPVWVFTQFNHPREVTKEAAAACDRLLSRGIPLGNQSVLMKGINDNIDTLVELYTKLIGIRVRPYYLYLCDRVNGTAHFYADYHTGMELTEQMRYRLPGYAVPKFIIDANGENGGKVTVEQNHIIQETDRYILLKGSSEDSVTKYYK